MFNLKLKGVGAATLDRGISIVIGSVILAGIVSGISWMYNLQKKDAFLNDLNVLSSGMKTYYNSKYSAVDINRVKQAGNLPSDFDTQQIGDVKMSKSPTFINFPEEVLESIKTDKPYGWEIQFTGLNYDLCLEAGKSRVIGLKYVTGSVTSTTLYFPSNLSSWESFCNSNAVAGGTINYVFQ